MGLTPSQEEAEAVLGTVTKIVGDVTNSIWSLSSDSFRFLAEQLSEKLFKPLQEMPSNSWDNMLNFYMGVGVITQSDKTNILKLKEFGQPWEMIIYIVTQMKLFTGFLSATSDPAVMKMQQGVAKMMRPQLPYVSEVLGAAFIAPEKTGEVREILARSGYSEDAIDLLFISKYRPYEEFQIQQLWLRKEINDGRMYERMRELGYTDTRIGELVKPWTIIPQVQDILTMVAHEAFEPDAVQQMGLEDEFPSAQADWLTKQGLSPFWQKKYWAAHWDQPSIQMGFEMLHRQVIDRDTLDMLFRTVELPPYWRDKLTQIAYQPYTRVDVRRMYDMGVLDESQLHRAYTDIGYDKEHADGMTEFTKRYVEDADRDLTKTEILKGYRNALLSALDTRSLLQDIRYTEAQALYYIELEDYRELEATQSAAIATIKARYTANLIDRADAQRLLDALNIPAAQVNLWLQRWDVSIIEYPKLPSKTDLDKFYIADVINADQYHLEMLKLGYGQIYIGWYKQMADKIKGRAG